MDENECEGGRADTWPDGSRVDVLGVGVSPVSPADVVDVVDRWVDARERHYVCVSGVHGVMESQRDPDLLTIHNRSGLTVPDGMPLVWACHRAGMRAVSRVYGPDLMRALCRRAAERGWRIFLYGATEETVDKLVATLLADYPGIQIAGRYCPPFRPLTDGERQDVVARINAADADLVFVGLSTPKQERWMSENRELLGAPVLLGVGAAFDLVPGLKRQAPGALQRLGMEWAFRLATEPRRLWRRYLRNNPAFVAAIVRRPPRLAVGPSPRDSS